MTLEVACVNDAPTFTKGPDRTVDEDSGPQTFDPWATGIGAGPGDESAQALTFSVTGNTNPTLFSSGPAVSPSGVLTFTPTAGEEGSASITVVLGDDGGTADGGADTSAPQTFTITVSHVNAKPVAAADSYAATEDGPAVTVAAPGLLGNDTDGDGEALTASVVEGPEHEASFSAAADGSFSYTPAANFCGTDSFTYRASDGTDTSAAATVTIAVSCANDAPVVTASAGKATYAENAAPVSVDPALAVTDVEGDQLTGATATITSGLAVADTLAFTPSGGITGSYGAGTLTLSGTASAAAYQAALRSVTFANGSEGPSAGDRAVRFSVTDSGALTGSGDRSVTVVPVNDPPVAVADGSGTDDDTPLSVAAPGVLGNDTDVDPGDTKTVVELNGSATLTGTSAKGAAVTVGANGAWTYNPGSVFLALSDGETDTDTFAYTMADSGDARSSAQVTVTITGKSGVPVAVADSFNAIGNTGLFVGTTRPDGQPGSAVAGSLLANDTDPDTPAAGLVAEPVTNAPTTLGGTITVEADGNFTYHPDDVDTGVTDTFTYRVCDRTPCNSGTVANATGTLSLPIAGQVWYVRNNQAAGGDGTSDTPFDTLAEAETASGNGDTVFVFDGNNTTTNLDTGYVLETNETLLGQELPLVLDPDGLGPLVAAALHPGTSGARPTLSASNEDVVTLASGSRVDGFNLDPSGTGGGIGGGPGAGGPAAIGATIANVTVSDTGTAGTQPGLDLDGMTGTTSVSDLVVDNGGSATAIGVRLNNAGTVVFAPAGTISVTTAGARVLAATGTAFGAGSTFDSLTSTGSGTGGVSLQTVTGPVALGDGSGTDLALTTTSGSAAALLVAGAGAVTVPAGGTADVNATGGPAVDVTAAPGSSLALDTVSSTNSAADGVNLGGLAAGTFSATAGTLAGFTGIGFDLDGGSGDVSYAGALNNGPGQSAEVTGRTGGVATFSGNIADSNDAGGGIVLSSNFGGSTVLSGASKVLNTGSSDAVGMLSSDGHTLSVTGGGLDIDTTSGRGINASSSGTIAVAGTGNTVDSGTGRAVSVTDTDIGTADLTLQKVAANGAASGVVLDNTGALGGLIVTGNGGACATTADACTGGTIQSTTGDAVSLKSTREVSLTRLKIANSLGNGIRGATVTGFDLVDSVVDNNGDDAATDEAGLHFTNLAGTASVTRTLVANSPEDNARIINSSGTLSQFDITDSTFRDTDTVSPGNNGLLVQADGGSITADVLGSTFLRNRANGLQVITNGTGTIDVEVDDSGTKQSSFDDNNIGVSIAHNSSGTLSFDVRDLTIDGLNVAPGTGGSASPININLAGSATNLMSGTVSGNTLTNSNSTTGPGVRIVGNGTATLTALVSGNTISQVANRGIEVIARDGSNRINVTVENNSVALNNALAADAIRVDAGAVGTDTTTVCADIRGNAATTTAAGLFGVRVRQRFAGTSYFLEDYAGAATDDAAAQTFLSTNNNGATTSADHAGAGFKSTADCQMPS